jgi:hypothetical protein
MAVWTSQSSADKLIHIIGANDSEHLSTMHLRDDITDLNIMDLDIVSINVSFPKNVTKLSIGSCRNLMHIPAFPQNLKYLHISSLPSLAKIPEIPRTVTHLTICQTNVAYLHSLEHLKLTDCYLHTNKLTLIPALPNTIKNFNCFYNPLTMLPILPVPVEKMDYVELDKPGNALTFDEEQELFAECVEILNKYNIRNNLNN